MAGESQLTKKVIYQFNRSVAGFNHPPRFFGDHIVKVTPVPIPNTEVKLSEPMIVPKARK